MYSSPEQRYHDFAKPVGGAVAVRPRRRHHPGEHGGESAALEGDRSLPRPRRRGRWQRGPPTWIARA